MSLYLVRHARAGSRQRWTKADDLRPLSKLGRVQASGIAKARARSHVTRIVSSPFVRCRETVEPLARKLGLDVELSDSLAEGAPVAQSLRLIEKLLDQEAVLCTHGDVLGDVLEHYASLGVKLRGDRADKACTWVLDIVDGEVSRARYVPPPGSKS